MPLAFVMTVLQTVTYRAQYGETVIKDLSSRLTSIYGKGFTKTNLYSYLDFYNTYPEIFHLTSGKSVSLLSWSHFRTLLQVKDKEASDWYMNEAARESWNVCDTAAQHIFSVLLSLIAVATKGFGSR